METVNDTDLKALLKSILKIVKDPDKAGSDIQDEIRELITDAIGDEPEFPGDVKYIDEDGNEGECTLQEFIDANCFGDDDPNDVRAIMAIKVGETVRYNGFMGRYHDVTRTK